MPKIVVNRCYGGFGLSEAAWEKYLDLKGIKYYKWKDPKWSSWNYTSCPMEEYYLPDDKVRHEHYLSYYDIKRDDPVLVQVVEELLESADGDHAALDVVDVPDDVDWIIEEYDGKEWVAEKHRTW